MERKIFSENSIIMDWCASTLTAPSCWPFSSTNMITLIRMQKRFLGMREVFYRSNSIILRIHVPAEMESGFVRKECVIHDSILPAPDAIVPRALSLIPALGQSSCLRANVLLEYWFRCCLTAQHDEPYDVPCWLCFLLGYSSEWITHYTSMITSKKCIASEHVHIWHLQWPTYDR
jgi:hypothetical protein